jgi:glycosyltransferase involved in cell wall biosynthesis
MHLINQSLGPHPKPPTDTRIMVSILFVDHTANLGGGELCLLDLALLHRSSCRVALLTDGPLYKRLLDCGISVKVLKSSPALHQVRKRVKVSAILKALSGIFTDAQTIAAEAKNFDVIWANTHKAFVVSALSTLFSRKPVVYHLHDLLDSSHFSFWNRKGVVILANYFARCVVANSQATACSFMASGGKKNLLHTLYNGFEFSNALKPAAVYDTMQTSCHFWPDIREEKRFVIGLFSRLTFWKGQHILLEALASLPAHFCALVVGDALFPEDKDYVHCLEQQVEALGLKDRVRFLGFREDAWALMASCDVLVHCSVLAEPFGRVVVEGMATGKPMVAVNAGGVPEIIEDQQTGLLVPSGDASALAKAVQNLESDPVWAKELGEAGRKTVMSRFNLQETALRMEQILIATHT